MSEKKYCRLRHKKTKYEVKIVADEVGGVHIIRYFYSKANGLFDMVYQSCLDDEIFDAAWNNIIKEYQKSDWEVIE